MPSPREQPSPPGGKQRRRPDVMPGGWLWLVLLILLVLVILVTLGFPNANTLGYSEFEELAKQGQNVLDRPPQEKKGEAPASDKIILPNKVIKKVVFVGADRLEGEIAELEDGVTTVTGRKLPSKSKFSVL